MSIACFTISLQNGGLLFIRKSKLFWWMWLVQSVFERVDVIGRLTVRHRGNPTQFSHVNWCEKFQAWIWCEIFHTWNFFIHEIGVNFLSGMFNLVPHVKFLICIHFKHVSGVNQVWNRPDLMRIFCTGCQSTFFLLSFIRHFSRLCVLEFPLIASYRSMRSYDWSAVYISKCSQHME